MGLFFTTMRIKVVASDGFREISDEFTIYFEAITLNLIIKLFFLFGSPFIGMLGLWKFRVPIYNLLYYYYSV
jgi:hypothetical protein